MTQTCPEGLCSAETTPLFSLQSQGDGGDFRARRSYASCSLPDINPTGPFREVFPIKKLGPRAGYVKWRNSYNREHAQLSAVSAVFGFLFGFCRIVCRRTCLRSFRAQS